MKLWLHDTMLLVTSSKEILTPSSLYQNTVTLKSMLAAVANLTDIIKIAIKFTKEKF